MGRHRPLPLVACLALAGCSFQVDDGAARYRCDQGDRCPEGTSCRDGWCEQFDAGTLPLPRCEATANSRLTFEPGRSAQTDLAWNGNDFGLVWTQIGANAEVHFDLVAADGTPSKSPVTVSNPAATSTWPTIAWTGQLFGVFFAARDTGATSHLAYRPVQPDGEPVLDNPLELAPSQSGAVPTRAQELGPDTLQGVAWQSQVEGNDEVYFNRFSGAGTAASTSIVVTENLGASWFPSLAWTGSEWGVAWNDDRDGNIEIYFTRLDASGERVEGDRRISNAPRASFAPALIWTGEAYLISWWDGRADPTEMFAARLVPESATAIGPEIRLRPGEYGQVGLLARAGDQIGLAWHTLIDDLMVPVFALLDPATGELLTTPLPLSDGAVSIDLESLAMVGTDSGFAVVWGDDRSGDIEIYFTHVACQ